MRAWLLRILPSGSTIITSPWISCSFSATNWLKKPRVTSMVDTPKGAPSFMMAMAQLVRGWALASSL